MLPYYHVIFSNMGFMLEEIKKHINIDALEHNQNNIKGGIEQCVKEAEGFLEKALADKGRDLAHPLAVVAVSVISCESALDNVFTLLKGESSSNPCRAEKAVDILSETYAVSALFEDLCRTLKNSGDLPDRDPKALIIGCRELLASVMPCISYDMKLLQSAATLKNMLSDM